MSLPLILRLIFPALLAGIAITLPEDESDEDEGNSRRNRGRPRRRRPRRHNHAGDARELESGIPPAIGENEDERTSEGSPDRVRGRDPGRERPGSEIQVLAPVAPEPEPEIQQPPAQ